MILLLFLRQNPEVCNGKMLLGPPRNYPVRCRYSIFPHAVHLRGAFLRVCTRFWSTISLECEQHISSLAKTAGCQDPCNGFRLRQALQGWAKGSSCLKGTWESVSPAMPGCCLSCPQSAHQGLSSCFSKQPFLALQIYLAAAPFRLDIPVNKSGWLYINTVSGYKIYKTGNA